MWNPRATFAGLLLAAFLIPACVERPASDSAAGALDGAGVGALKFIENDAPRALAEAKRRGVPICVEAWAPW